MKELMSPQTQIFNAVFKSSLQLGYDTYDFLPADEVSYPFVYIGEQFDEDHHNKSIIFGDVQQTIHIFHSYRERGALSIMMDNLKVECRKMKRTKNFYVRCRNIRSRTFVDTSTGEPLLHGVIEADFRFQ